MVVGLALAAVQMGMALPTGFLFGVGYGTGVRIGYEQVYPLLFPKGARSTTSELAATMKGMNTVYDAIGGKDASRMGIAVGITNAGEILNNPDFQVLDQLESSSYGLTSSSSNRSRYGLDQESVQEDPSSKTGSDTSYFQSFYQAISSFNLTQTTSAYGEATQYRNGFTRQQNDEFLIPALRTRLAQLRDPSSQQTIQEKNQEQLENRDQPEPAPYRDATSQEIEYNIFSANLESLMRTFLIIKNQYNAVKNKTDDASINAASRLRAKLSDRSRSIRNISNDYRNPNNTIRNRVIRLRQEIANGFLKYTA